MNPRKIKTQEAYDDLFSDKEARIAALKVALDLRKFELDLYWRRAAYFWAFAAVILAGYFALLTSPSVPIESKESYLLVISALGFCFSLGWFLAVRGGKFWSSNWELHVDYLELNHIGPLFTTVLDKDCLKWWKMHKAYPHSVGKINQALGILILSVWLALILHNFLHVALGKHPDPRPYLLWGIPVMVLSFVIFVWFKTQTDFKSRESENQWFISRRLTESCNIVKSIKDGE